MENKYPHWPCPNNCMTWCRDDVSFFGTEAKPAPNHHPRCEHVDASLIDVWSVRIEGERSGCVFDDKAEAEMFVEDNSEPDQPLEIVPVKMHREVFDQLGEFGGF